MQFSIILSLFLIFVSLPAVEATQNIVGLQKNGGSVDLTVTINPTFYYKLRLAEITSFGFTAKCYNGIDQQSNQFPIDLIMSWSSPACSSDILSIDLFMLRNNTNVILCGNFQPPRDAAGFKLALASCPNYKPKFSSQY